MKTFIVDFPIIGWGSVSVETDFEDSEELRQAIINDEFDVPIDKDCIQSWSPLMNVKDATWEVEELEVVE